MPTKKSSKKSSKPEKAVKSKYPTSWDFSDIYKNIDDPKIEADMKMIEKLYESFAKKYRDIDFTKDEDSLFEALNSSEQLSVKRMSWRPYWYLFRMQTIDSNNSKLDSKLNLIQKRYADAVSKIMFFPIKIAKTPIELQQKYLKSEKLKKYHRALEVRFEEGKHFLSEEAEKVMLKKNQPAHSMWVKANQKFTNKAKVLWKGKELSLTEANAMKVMLPLKERRALHELIAKKNKDISFFAEPELNAVITNKKINDDLRGYKKPYSATIQSYENDEATVLALIKAVEKFSHIPPKAFELKRKLMNLPHLTVADIAVSPAKVQKKFSFDEGVELCLRAFEKFDPFCSDLLRDMLKNKRIDAFPRPGKRSGAYCSGGTGIPTIVFMNFANNLDSVSTLAHEMGHSIHTELSKIQPPVYDDYVISVAEVASTFFESILADEVEENLTPREKVIQKYERIQDDLGVIFRQVDFFNYELFLHDGINSKGSLSIDEMAKEWMRMGQKYYGKAVKITGDDGYGFIGVPHFRYFFYVYSYAYGQLISKALFARYKKDPSYKEKIMSFLKAGGSKSPADIFKSIGIDTTDPQFYMDGLKLIEKDLKDLEKLAKKEKMIK